MTFRLVSLGIFRNKRNFCKGSPVFPVDTSQWKFNLCSIYRFLGISSALYNQLLTFRGLLSGQASRGSLKYGTRSSQREIISEFFYKRIRQLLTNLTFRGWYDAAFRFGQETQQKLFPRINERSQSRWTSRATCFSSVPRDLNVPSITSSGSCFHTRNWRKKQAGKFKNLLKTRVKFPSLFCWQSLGNRLGCNFVVFLVDYVPLCTNSTTTFLRYFSRVYFRPIIFNRFDQSHIHQKRQNLSFSFKQLQALRALRTGKSGCVFPREFMH